MAPTSPLRNQTLLFDADDTLWENNIYFERAISAFISYLDHRVHTAEEVREHLNRVEHATIAKLGYGMRSFRRSVDHLLSNSSLKHPSPTKNIAGSQVSRSPSPSRRSSSCRMSQPSSRNSPSVTRSTW